MTTSNWITAGDCRLADLAAVRHIATDPSDYPFATSVEKGVLVYDASVLRERIVDEAARRAVMSELARALKDGPGVLVFAGAYPDTSVVEAASAEFQAIIDAEKAAGTAPGDHFAMAGANDRVWNALEKLAVRNPEVFARYYSNDMIALVSEAWLGRGYQVTSQVNQVNPGGKAQSPHRDYHLGFQSQASAESYPGHVHALSPALTLQGAVAHCDMTVESGPTMLLPHSQKYAAGYVAWHLPEFQQYFADNYVQLPLRTGDAVFFNPALHHAAGENKTTDVKRMVNLLQVSSAFGRAMESIDRERIVNAVYPVLRAMQASGTVRAEILNAVAASAEGYAFPTNLDRDQPSGSDAPPAQADIVRHALDQDWDEERLADALRTYRTAHLSH
jgi:ectoine hydroxylase-related dioxygenase (phytanoyl-CoA dioxygenase family)